MVTDSGVVLSSESWLDSEALAELSGVSTRSARRALHRASKGQEWRGAHLVVRVVRGTRGRAGRRYEVRADSLPEDLLVAWLRKTRPAPTAEERRAAVEQHNATVVAAVRDAIARGEPLPRGVRVRSLPITDHAEADRIHQRYLDAPGWRKDEAELRYEIVKTAQTLLIEGLSKSEINRALRDQFGVSATSVWRYLDLVRGQPERIWLALLLPEGGGGRPKAEIPAEFWDDLLGQWATTSKPPLRPLYRRLKAEATRQGWSIPSYDTFRRRIQEIPLGQRVYLREGRKALDALIPYQARDYSTLRAHELWNLDGRLADVFVRWPDGEVGRPTVIGVQEVRSRYMLHLEVARTESTDAIRRAFTAAVSAAKALPEVVLLDNGRGFAAKPMTGGVPNRFRFKVAEGEPPGIWPLLGIGVTWALPYSGRSKPIERAWRTLADLADKSAEFVGAYCGSSTATKPEDFAPSKAVPVESYQRALQSAVAQYNINQHRGDSMDGRSPHQALEEELTKTAPRQPTEAQLALCARTFVPVKPDRRNSSIVVNGNRYWSPKLVGLAPGGSYFAGFDPDDARVPVLLYDGERLLFEVPLTAREGFRNAAAAKEHQKARRREVKAVRALADARRDKAKAAQWTVPTSAPQQDPSGPVPPVAKVASLARTKLALPRMSSTPQSEDPEVIRLRRIGEEADREELEEIMSRTKKARTW